MKTIIFNLVAILVSATSFADPSSRATLICEEGGAKLKLTVDNEKKALHAWLTLDSATEEFEHAKLDKNFLNNAQGGFSWAVVLDNDVMDTLKLTYNHYSDELRYARDNFGSVETHVFSMEKSCTMWSSDQGEKKPITY